MRWGAGGETLGEAEATTALCPVGTDPAALPTTPESRQHRDYAIFADEETEAREKFVQANDTAGFGQSQNRFHEGSIMPAAPNTSHHSSPLASWVLSLVLD